jgi:hypothetical protein
MIDESGDDVIILDENANAVPGESKSVKAANSKSRKKQPLATITNKARQEATAVSSIAEICQPAKSKIDLKERIKEIGETVLDKRETEMNDAQQVWHL